VRIPEIHGLIERRILITYRVDPVVARSLLPEEFEPRLVRGFAVAGICLIRLSGVRPVYWPARLGLSSENAAHRFAVTWRDGLELLEGVYIPRRDTSSHLNTFLGGRVFPGLHHYAQFRVRESADYLHVAMTSDDQRVDLAINAHTTEEWQSGLFDSLGEASNFFRTGSRGYSPAAAAKAYEGLDLRCDHWHVDPLEVRQIRSSYFDDTRLFPAGSAEFDCALLMRDIPHRWIGLRNLARAQGQRESAACC
jgi:hypothetical protein